MALTSAAACQRFIDTHEPPQIAARLRQDQDLCRSGRLPSLLALFLPPTPSPLADSIARVLDTSQNIPISLSRLQYAGILDGIKGSIQDMGKDTEGTNTIPTTSDFESALKVLDYFRSQASVAHLTASSTFADVETAINTQLSINPQLRASYRSSSSQKRKHVQRRCYICRLVTSRSHDLYASLCRPCGAFNLAESGLSLPDSLNLTGKTAFITGARVNLGFCTALRLLRCGAHVIISTRYPRDAEVRYRSEHDFDSWGERLRVIGADFRAAKDVFRLVTVVKRLLLEWQPENPKLDILVNNAAQTLTDSVTEENESVDRELLLSSQADARLLVDDSTGYSARLRGGAVMEWETPQLLIKGGNAATETKLGQVLGKSSWMQVLDEIPYEDVINAHSVNTFVPLILCRELLPLMGSQVREPLFSNFPTKPLGYIVNVSSREGIFEYRGNSGAKRGHHVHTNMSKAALNMITETEGNVAWKVRRVAMNTVDPGYMSSAPEFRDRDCPIGWEDGAGRVLWPIAVGEIRNEPIHGRFLKHFGEVPVEVGEGR